jgi:hypothetical protein
LFAAHGTFHVPENTQRKMIEEKTIPGLVCIKIWVLAFALACRVVSGEKRHVERLMCDVRKVGVANRRAK